MKQIFVLTLSLIIFNHSNAFHNDHSCMSHKKKVYQKKSGKSNGTSVTQYIPTHDFDLLHTDLNLKPLWNEKQMKGEAILTMVPYFYPKSEVTLDAKYFDIHEVKWMLKKGSTPLSFSYTDSMKLKISLPKEFSKKDTLKIFIKYTANPERIKSLGGKAISADKGLYFINVDGSRKNVPTQLWTQGEPEANSGWFPTFDYPSEKHSQTLKVTYDKKYVSLSNGALVSSKLNADGTKTDVWNQKKPHAVYLTALIVGDFKIVSDKYKNITVNYLMEPQYEEMARPIFGRTPEMIEFFSKRLDYPFAWEKYSQVIVHDYVSGAMENTSAVTFNTMFQKDRRELIDDNDDETVAHELFHHWFGDVATCESWTHLTLNESFANYSEYLWNEHKHGLDEAQAQWQKDMAPYYQMANSKKEPLVRYDYEKPDDMFDVITYNKGGKILHMLRTYIGDEAFFKMISIYLKRFEFKTAEYSNLRMIAEEVTGMDLTWFFNQWYLKGGHPVITTSYKKADSGIYLFVGQKHSFDSSFLYRLPIKVDIYTEKGKITKDIDVRNKIDSFFVATTSPILAVNFDATKTLIANKNESKKTAEWVYLLKNTPNYLDQREALVKIKNQMHKSEVYEAVLQSLSSPKHRIVERSISYFDKEQIDTSARLENQLVELAKNGKTGALRAAALGAIENAKISSKYSDLIKNALNDSSYKVETKALKMLVALDSVAALQRAIKSTQSKSAQLKNTAFEIIANTKDEAYFELFKTAAEEASDYGKISVYPNFGKYAASLSDSNFNKSIEIFKKLKDSSDEYDKYSLTASFNTLLTALSKKEDAVSKKRYTEVSELYKTFKDKDEEEEEEK
jgi:aminopeptidase N